MLRGDADARLDLWELPKLLEHRGELDRLGARAKDS